MSLSASCWLTATVTMTTWFPCVFWPLSASPVLWTFWNDATESPTAMTGTRARSNRLARQCLALGQPLVHCVFEGRAAVDGLLGDVRLHGVEPGYGASVRAVDVGEDGGRADYGEQKGQGDEAEPSFHRSSYLQSRGV